LGEASEHDFDHGEPEPGGDGASVTLEVAGETTVAADPGEGALDNPAFGQDDEAMGVAAFDDLHGPVPGRGDGLGEFRALIAGIGEDAFDERKRPPRLTQQIAGPVAVLHIGRVDDDAQQQAKRIDEDVPLAARDFLARVIALRVDRGAPF